MCFVLITIEKWISSWAEGLVGVGGGWLGLSQIELSWRTLLVRSSHRKSTAANIVSCSIYLLICQGWPQAALRAALLYKKNQLNALQAYILLWKQPGALTSWGVNSCQSSFPRGVPSASSSPQSTKAASKSEMPICQCVWNAIHSLRSRELAGYCFEMGPLDI